MSSDNVVRIIIIIVVSPSSQHSGSNGCNGDTLSVEQGGVKTEARTGD